MSTQTNLIRKAIAVFGGQKELAAAAGITQQAISGLLRGRNRAEPQTAIAIDKATGGAVSREDLRPDIFETPHD